MKPRVLILGAGFGGLELASTVSEELGEEIEITLIDKADAFVFGYSKLDVLFGRTTLDAVELPYSALAKPGLRFVKETIVAIDPSERRVTTSAGVHEADHLVIALGADYDLDATPGLGDGDNEFYSVAGAARMAQLLPSFSKGRAVIGVCGTPFKCPPAPSECALLLHDHLVARGVRGDCEIEFVIPFGTPVPPSPDTSAALIEAFAERGIAFVPSRCPVALDTAHRVVTLDDGSERSYDLFFGVPKHRAPDVVIESGMSEGGYIPVAPATLQTRYPGVYACGDVATVGVPKAGVFAEGAARVVARELIAKLRGERSPAAYDGRGSCYIEFGAGRVGRVDVDFFSGPKPTGTYQPPSMELVAEKQLFGSTRRARWFGL
jgi:sulfide:quinone oxidoreductase